MADDKSGRDEQAQNVDRRQRERDMAAAVERGDEPEPPIESTELADFETELEALSFPATGTEVVAAIGDRAIESAERSFTVAELVPETDAETFDAPDAVRVQIRRPTVAAAMTRVVEASETLPNAEFSWSQRTAYETTFRELEAIDPDDEDEGIRVVTDWIVERIHEKEWLPSSRDVRRRAAKFCRTNGYQVRTDEWLGV
ncbi:hypothetical protein GCM10028857_03890 [Salinarchaeum chitinilyticum]